MRRSLLLAALAAGIVSGTSAAWSFETLVAETTANRHGLTRPWFNQVEFDSARGRVTGMTLYDGVLYLQTDRAQVHAMDAETGQSLWVRRAGNPAYATLPIGVNDEMVAVVNGSTLYVLNRYNGKLIWQTRLEHVPGGGVTMSQQRVYVPMIDGIIASYRLDPDPQRRLRERVVREDPALADLPLDQPDEEMVVDDGADSAAERARLDAFRLPQEYIRPLTTHSYGRAWVPPLVTRQNTAEEFVAWATDRGMMFVGHIDRSADRRFRVVFRLDTHGVISAPPTLLPPDPDIVGDSGVIFAVSYDGTVYAMRERDGSELWQFPTGEPIAVPAVVVARRVYATTRLGGMYCLDARTGEQQWWAPQIADFVASSGNRIYVSDRQGRLIVLRADTGARIDVLPVDPKMLKYRNDQTDRIYLASASGLVQCLREIEHDEPVRHRPPGQIVEVEAEPVVRERDDRGPAAPPAPAAPAPAAPPPPPAPAPPPPPADPFGAMPDDPFGPEPPDPFEDPFR